MEAKGFVRMEPSAEDRRCKRIAVTDRAMQVNQQVLDQLDAAEQLMISGFSPEEVEQLHNLFARMIHNLTPTTDEGGINP